MAKYTIELGTLINSGFDIGLTDYPIPSFADEAWRDALNKKIIAHYLYREICCTPPERFRHFLNITMNEVMPKIIPIYEVLNAGYQYNPGYSESKAGSDNGENTSKDNSNSYSLGVQSDTPGKMLNVEDDIQSNTYASSADKSKGNRTSNTQSSRNSSYTDTRTVRGTYAKSEAQIFDEYSKLYPNPDMLVIEAIEDCFMTIF